MIRHEYWCGHVQNINPPRDTDEDFTLHMQACGACHEALEAQIAPLRVALHRRDVVTLERLCADAIATHMRYPYVHLPHWLEEEIASSSSQRTVADIVGLLLEDDAAFEAFKERSSEEGCSQEEWEWAMFVGERTFDRTLGELRLYIGVQEQLRRLGTTDISSNMARRVVMTVGSLAPNPTVQHHCSYCGASPLVTGQPVIVMTIDDDGPRLVCPSCARELFQNIMDHAEEDQSWLGLAPQSTPMDEPQPSW